jgi:hypothetical protein
MDGWNVLITAEMAASVLQLLLDPSMRMLRRVETASQSGDCSAPEE